jgi:hypothetical protein
VPEPVFASNGSLIPRIDIKFIARPHIDLSDCTGPLRVCGHSNHCTYVRHSENAISCPGNPIFVPSRHKQFDRSIANTVTRLQNSDREMLPIPTPQHNAGKCNRGCYAHFKKTGKAKVAAASGSVPRADEEEEEEF